MSRAEYEEVKKILAKQYRWREEQRPTPDDWRLLLYWMDNGILCCSHFIFYFRPDYAGL